jgi:hypothetical protein
VGEAALHLGGDPTCGPTFLLARRWMEAFSYGDGRKGDTMKTATRLGAALAFSVALVGTAPAGAVAAPATEAQAADVKACARTKGNAAGVCFYPARRNKLTLWDNACDKHRVYAVIAYNARQWEWRPATQCRRSYSRTITYNGGDIAVRACVEDWGENTCSGWARY